MEPEQSRLQKLRPTPMDPQQIAGNSYFLKRDRDEKEGEETKKPSSNKVPKR